MPARARVAQRALAWVEAILSVVWRAWRIRSAMAVSSRGRLVTASRYGATIWMRTARQSG